MSQKLFLNTGLETIKGGALHALKDAGNAGAYDFATLDLTGVVVDQETFTLGTDVYEVNVVATDTGAESTVQVEAGDTSIIFDVAPTIPLLPGDVIRMESEFMIVVDYNVNGPSANVVRGAFGSTAAQHTIVNSDTFQAAQPVAAGNFAVPVSSTAAATAKGEIAAAVGFWSTGWRKGLGGGTGVTVQNGLKVDAFVGAGTNDVVFAYPADGGVATTAETFTNGTLSAFAGGVEPAELVYTKHVLVAAGTGAISFVAPWDVAEAWVTLHAADGAIIEAAANTVTVTNNRLVTVSAAGSLAAGVVVTVHMLAS
jgi:hypothetical protein